MHVFLTLAAVAGILLMALTGCAQDPGYYSPVPAEQGYAPAYPPYVPSPPAGVVVLRQGERAVCE